MQDVEISCSLPNCSPSPSRVKLIPPTLLSAPTAQTWCHRPQPQSALIQRYHKHNHRRNVWGLEVFPSIFMPGLCGLGLELMPRDIVWLYLGQQGTSARVVFDVRTNSDIISPGPFYLPTYIDTTRAVVMIAYYIENDYLHECKLALCHVLHLRHCPSCSRYMEHVTRSAYWSVTPGSILFTKLIMQTERRSEETRGFPACHASIKDVPDVFPGQNTLSQNPRVRALR